MLNWNELLQQPSDVDLFRNFALGRVPRRQIELHGGPARKAIRSRGVKRFRKSTREALRRRQLI